MIDTQKIELKSTYQILIGRLLIIAFALSTSVIQEFAKTNTPRTYLYQLFVLYSLISLFYFLVVKLFPVQRTFIFFQLILDVLVITLFVTISGLTDSIFVNLYFVIIIIGSIFLSFTQGLLLALFSMITLSFVSITTHQKIMQIFIGSFNYTDFMAENLFTLIAKLLTISFGLIFVAILSGFLSIRYKHETVLISEILANLSNGVMVVDAKDNLTYINQELFNLFGLNTDIEDYNQKNYKELLKKIKCEFIEKQHEKKELNAIEFSYSISEDNQKLFELRSIPIIKKEHIVKAMIYIFTDRTLQKEIKEINQRNERLSIVNDLAANIVHEIRNPIACISGAVQEVKRTETLDPSNQKLLNIALKESNRLSDIVTNFLEYSRIKTDTNATCDLVQTLDELITIMKQNPNTNNITFKFEQTQSIHCLGHSDKLHQVFLNLTLNAVEALTQGGEITYTITQVSPSQLTGSTKKFFEKQKTILCVTVADNGPGVSPDLVDKIFDPFFTTKASGTGLGLSIVQKIVESQGGLIQVRTKPNQGTSFMVYLITEQIAI